MKRILTYFYLPVAVLYLFMGLVFPMDPVTIARRHFSLGQARVMDFTVAVPLIIIWFLAIYGSWRLKEYSSHIKKYRDGAAFTELATGVQVLAVYLPIRSVTKVLLNYLAHVQPALTDITNLTITYINIIIPLVAFILIGHAAHNLLRTLKVTTPLRVLYSLVLVFSVLGAVYCYAVFTPNQALTPSDWLVMTKYDIPALLRILTIIVPYLVMWFAGILAVAEIYLYQRHVKGVLYRSSLRMLAFGLGLAITASIATQYINSVTATLRTLPATVTMLVAYAVLLLLMAAFVMVTKGVRKLQRLEEV